MKKDKNDIKIYDKLNKILQKNLYKMEITDYFLYMRLEKLNNLFKSCSNTIKSNNEIIPIPDKNMSKEEIIFIVYDFLSLVSPEYEKEFLKDLKTSRIRFNSKKESYIIKTRKGWIINIKQTNTLQDAQILIHEYFHKLNINFENERETIERNVFTEAISIMAELKFIDYLQEKNFSKNDIDLLRENRYKIFSSNIDIDLFELPLYIEYKNNGHINPEYYENNKDDLIGSEELFNKNILKFNDKKGNSLLNTYKHTLGMIYAAAFHNSSKNTYSDLYNINELIKKTHTIDFIGKYLNINDESILEYSIAKELNTERNYKNKK